mmetsp:Transcript_21204/g.23611  ORF Transcript_21204/g.23611 Transcript_21204/m.23611 type:complete len:141 (-) Transcript_21204:1-423(-)
MIDSNIFNKLENDIENLQKDRDSVFYLDDSFYNKLMDLYIHPYNGEKEKKTTEVYENKETIDDVRMAESKEEQESSENSEDNNSVESDEEDSDESESILASFSESIKDSIQEPSLEGIGDNNQMSSALSKVRSLIVSKPQ